jgi:hypothetical protein
MSLVLISAAVSSSQEKNDKNSNSIRLFMLINYCFTQEKTANGIICVQDSPQGTQPGIMDMFSHLHSPALQATNKIFIEYKPLNNNEHIKITC